MESPASNLLFSVITEARADELTIFERLYVAENAGVASHDGWHADLYVKCGCLERAHQYFKIYEHVRKLGDISWAQGDLESANGYYSTPPGRVGHTSRYDKDWDRLLKLSFFRSDWPAVIQILSEAPISFSPMRRNRIVLGNSEVSATPYLKMLAVACAKTSSRLPSHVADALLTVFQLSSDEWDRLLVASAALSDANISTLQRQCVPTLASKPAITLSEACEKGNTQRSRAVLLFLKDASTHLSRARRDLKAFLKTGEDQYLRQFLDTVLLAGITSVGHSILFHYLEMGQLNMSDTPPERLIRLYGCHPVMNKRYFGRLLQVKFDLHEAVSASEILTGMFQKLASITTAINEVTGKAASHLLDYNKLASCRDWAIMRLDEWLNGEGKRATQAVAETWRNRTYQPVAGPFHGGKRSPSSPRDMAEWLDLVDQALDWLGAMWQREIGVTPWVSENNLFQLLKRVLKPLDVFQHAQPVWLAPQHLDVFVPELSLAVEYMGEQHYAPIEYFGGEEGYRSTLERDQRKAALCREVGITLIYVRHDEVVEERVEQIRAIFHMNKSKDTSP